MQTTEERTTTRTPGARTEARPGALASLVSVLARAMLLCAFGACTLLSGVLLAAVGVLAGCLLVLALPISALWLAGRAGWRRLRLLLGAACLALLAATTLAGDFLEATSAWELRYRPYAGWGGGPDRGPYQMNEATWCDATGRLGVDWPWSDADDPRKARLAAEEQLRWLIQQFKRARRREPDAREAYAMWNLGLAGFRRHRWSVSRCPPLVRRGCEAVAAGTGDASVGSCLAPRVGAGATGKGKTT